MDLSPVLTNVPHNHAQCISDALEMAEAVCAKRGTRLTPIRRRVLELVWNGHKPVGAYAILDSLREGSKGAAPPTVYRALDFLMEEGLIHRIESLNAFVACDTRDHAHTAAFLLCDCCGSSEEIAIPAVPEIEATAARIGFQVKHVTLAAHGLCRGCQ